MNSVGTITHALSCPKCSREVDSVELPATADATTLAAFSGDLCEPCRRLRAWIPDLAAALAEALRPQTTRA